MKDKEKEIKYLIYLKSQLIKETKKEIRILRQELISEQKQKKMEMNKNDKKRNIS